jgi:hypothetical protein
MADSTQLRAVGGPLEAVEHAQDQLAAALSLLLRERKVRFYIEASDEEIATIARTLRTRARSVLTQLAFEAFQAGVDRNVEAAQHETPTRRITQPFRKP